MIENYNSHSQTTKSVKSWNMAVLSHGWSVLSIFALQCTSVLYVRSQPSKPVHVRPRLTPWQDGSATANHCAVPYGDVMFTTIVVWVVGLTVGYVGLRAIRTRSWSRPDQSED